MGFDTLFKSPTIPSQPAENVVAQPVAVQAPLPEMQKKPERKRRTPAPPKPYNYRSQQLPDEVYRKGYAVGNRHLPKATYAQDYDALLFETAANNRVNGITALLDDGRNINMTNWQGETPLIHAARYGALTSLRLLLARGALPNIGDTRGLTALHYAAYRKNATMVDALLSAGADPYQPDTNGISAATLAEKIPANTAIVEKLRSVVPPQPTVKNKSRPRKRSPI